MLSLCQQNIKTADQCWHTKGNKKSDLKVVSERSRYPPLENPTPRWQYFLKDINIGSLSTKHDRTWPWGTKVPWDKSLFWRDDTKWQANKTNKEPTNATEAYHFSLRDYRAHFHCHCLRKQRKQSHHANTSIGHNQVAHQSKEKRNNLWSSYIMSAC